MADLSFSFHWSQASSAIALAASAVSAVTAHSSAWDLGATAGAKADAASSAIATRSAKWDKGSAASTAGVSLASNVIRSLPASNSRAIHEIQMASNGQIHVVYSSVAVA